jgi:hypothetical protein
LLSARREFLAVITDDEFLAAQSDRAHLSALAIRFAATVIESAGTAP